MKSFKKFLVEGILCEKEFSRMKLYHGHPTYEKHFTNFKDGVTFFADDPKFAIQYAEQKSFEIMNDATIYLYDCTFSGKLFYIWNMNERQKLYDALPEKFKIQYSFFDTDIDKDKAIESMRGIGDKQTYDEAASKEVGETFSKDAPNDKYMIVKKETDKVYAIQPYSFDDLLRALYYQCDYHGSLNSQFFMVFRKHPISEYFEDIRNRTKELGKQKTVHASFMELQYTNQAKATELYQEAKKILLKALGDYPEKDLRVYPFNIKPSKVALRDTWYYFENETVINTLKELGYNGYVAKEKKYYTYAIFDIDKVKIDKVTKVRN